MNVIDLNSWEEFEQHIEELARKRSERICQTGYHISEYLFRGQSDNEFKLITTLERYTNRLLTLKDYYKIIHATKPQIETYTDTRWRIPSLSNYVARLEKSGMLPLGEFPAYEYFVYLRHHGFPSPLLDWTRSAFVAAYFAFRDVNSRANSVSIYAYCEFTAGHKLRVSRKPEITALGPYVRSHRRHFQQQSRYTVCTISQDTDLSYASHDEAIAKNNQDQDKLWKFNIPTSERYKVLSLLEQYNINAFSLFGSEESLMETVSLREIYLSKDTKS